ncbi:chemotaxis protein CheW [Phormidesmis sp. 146-33]
MLYPSEDSLKPMQNESKAEKFIAFAVEDYDLALPIAEVLQVVRCPLSPDPKVGKMGLVQIGQHMVRVLDLHQQLGAEPTSRPFLLIAHSFPGEFCAIPVSEPPSCIEFLRENMQRLPQSSPLSGVLAIASHALVIPQEETTTTILLLDIKRILNMTTPALAPG